MNDTDLVYCVTEVYDSTGAKGFVDSENYPIAWEIIFQNDKAGKKLIDNIYEAFDGFSKERGFILGLDGEQTDMARCMECVFNDPSSFNQVLFKALDGLTFNENKRQVVPRLQLVEAAKSIRPKLELAI